MIREDIACAKSYIAQSTMSRTDSLVDEWLKAQRLDEPDAVNTDAADWPNLLTTVARVLSARLAFYQAVWELVTVGDLMPSTGISQWQPELMYSTSRGAGELPVPGIKCFFYPEFVRPPVVDTVPNDPDIFLKGVPSQTLHDGIQEAVEQALGCFRRGLYMPATVMLAAAVEATWTECGIAVAKKLGDTKLDGVVSDQYSSISKIVVEIRKALEQPAGKTLIKDAGQHISKVIEAQVWTDAVRDRRNALHWGKAKSFIADHSQTGMLLMAAPMHLATLEAIRAAC